MPEGDEADSRNSRLPEIALLFLRLGCTAFGGPAAHIAMLEHECVRRRRWLTHERFLDLVGATNLIPGPNSTELAIHLGHLRGGMAGLIVGGVCFIAPAMLIVLAIAWSYATYGALPQADAILYGVKPVIIAVIVQALWKLTRTAAKTRLLACIGLAATGLVIAGLNELVVLALAGLAVLIARRIRPTGTAALIAIPLLPAAAATGGAAFGLWPMFLFFLKVGSVLFGSGYVLLAFLRSDLVERWHWLTESQLLDAVAVGQITPGPVFTTATFIGYLLGGWPAALLATLGIFLPAFFFVAISGPLIPRLRRSPVAGAILDGVNVGSLALMAVVSFQLAHAALVDLPTILLALVSGALLLRWQVNSAWLVLGGALAGLLLG